MFRYFEKYIVRRITQVSSSLDSSVGRAEDCRGTMQLSLGHWFESGSRDIFGAIEITENKKHDFLQYQLVKDWTLGMW